MILELLLDALLDSVKMLPFLFAAYWLIEYVEHRHSEGIEKALAGGGRFGFVPGAVLGLLPQCGFSAKMCIRDRYNILYIGELLVSVKMSRKGGRTWSSGTCRKRAAARRALM